MTTKKIIIPTLQTIHVWDINKVWEHTKRVNVAIQCTYTYLKPGSSCVGVCIKNLSTQALRILAKTELGKVTATNIVLQMLATKVTEKNEIEWSPKRAIVS